MDTEKRLVSSIIQFLGEQLASDELTAEDKEGLDVTIQCLESVYKISSADVHLLPSRRLIDIFRDATINDPKHKESDEPISEEAKWKAGDLKNRGNELMKSDMFKEALDSYTNAIKLDPKNAVFYCNRAAAYSKLNQHNFAIEDCKRAIEIDPNYSKAYGRMGLAYSNLNNHYLARDSFKRALELDPTNESYAGNLRVAEDSIRDMERRNPLATFFANPAIANVAEQLLQDPNLQNFVGGLMSNASFGGVPPSGAPQAGSGGDPAPGGAGMPPSGAPGANPDASSGSSGSTDPNPSGNETPLGGGLDAILRVGQQLASQVEASNPELIEQLRQRFSGTMNPPDNNNSDQNSGGGNNPP
ncbi:small glutamine-rich tetratricopeptide repeat-containing protein beta-like isoform X2 [Brevipalpus obovatus]|uniref:small glutamine-rich tetratricopeptide repeat-containing protein beta-like isoform X2 n=1 Tax=Brevipalpus obovatus TaxID=246614 RepID=UPI003D9F887B